MAPKLAIVQLPATHVHGRTCSASWRGTALYRQMVLSRAVLPIVRQHNQTVQMLLWWKSAGEDTMLAMLIWWKTTVYWTSSRYKLWSCNSIWVDMTGPFESLAVLVTDVCAYVFQAQAKLPMKPLNDWLQVCNSQGLHIVSNTTFLHCSCEFPCCRTFSFYLPILLMAEVIVAKVVLT